MRFTKTIATASVAAVLGLTGVSVAGAASNSAGTKPATSATAPAADSTTKHSRVAALRRRIRREGIALAAKTIGVTPADLRQEVLSGKTIAAVATEHGVAPQRVIDALVAAVNTKVDAAVTAGKITAVRGAKLKARLDSRIPKLVNDWHPKAKAAAQG